MDIGNLFAGHGSIGMGVKALGKRIRMGARVVDALSKGNSEGGAPS